MPVGTCTIDTPQMSLQSSYSAKLDNSKYKSLGGGGGEKIAEIAVLFFVS